MNDLRRLAQGLNQRASTWRPIFEALAAAETEAWDRFTAVLDKTGLDSSETRRYYVTGWSAAAFLNIHLGGFLALKLQAVFMAPLKIGLEMLIYGVLREKPDYATWGSGRTALMTSRLVSSPTFQTSWVLS